MAQCNRCIHDFVCKYKDKIAEMKEQHDFIKDISCTYQQNGAPQQPVQKTAKKGQPQAMENPDRKEGNAGPENNADGMTPEPESGNGNNTEQNNAQTQQPGQVPAQGRNEIMNIGIPYLKLSNPEYAETLKSIGISYISEVYDYENAKGWNGISRPMLQELSMKLQAFNLPALRI